MQDHKPIRAGVFESEPGAERAVSGLLEAGFPEDSIKLVASRSVPPHPEHPRVEQLPPAGSYTLGALAVGAAGGAVLGAAIAAIAAAALGGFGPTAVAVLAMAATVGAVVGGFVGAMLTRGAEPEIVDFHDQALDKGQYLVSVEQREGGPALSVAEDVFLRAGAEPLPLVRG